jgi:hypothetical protein
MASFHDIAFNAEAPTEIQKYLCEKNLLNVARFFVSLIRFASG